jgi:hypothetical protein
MRLTVLINGPDPTVNHHFALIWIDLDEHRWSRESHQGVELPSWGDVYTEGCATVLSAPRAKSPLCIMQGLSVNRQQQVQSSQGDASWSSNGTSDLTAWQWRLQAVERNAVRAEKAVFAG